MGMIRDWIVCCEREDGADLSAIEKQEIREAFGSVVYESYCNKCYEFSFSTTSFFAEDDVQEIISAYCPAHPEIIITVYIHYDTSDPPTRWIAKGGSLKVFEPEVVYNTFDEIQLPIKRTEDESHDSH